MDLTRFGHSCVLVEDGGGRVLLDPGTFSSGFEGLRDLTAVLITHQHADHLDAPRVAALLEANPDAALYLDAGSAGQVDLPHTVVEAGSRFDVGTSVQVFGSRHAVIHPDIPVVPNVGYLVGGRFFTPGDAFTVPDADVEVLGVPVAAPWQKLSEAVDYLRAVAPGRALPVHDGILASPQMYWGHLDRLGRTRFDALEPGATLSL